MWKLEHATYLENIEEAGHDDQRPPVVSLVRIDSGWESSTSVCTVPVARLVCLH